MYRGEVGAGCGGPGDQNREMRYRHPRAVHPPASDRSAESGCALVYVRSSLRAFDHEISLRAPHPRSFVT